MDVFRQFATNEDQENTGVWREMGGDAKLLIARSGNRAYGRMITKLYEQHQQALEIKGDSAEALSDKIMIEVIAKTILLGWEGVEYKGKPLEYNLENAQLLLAVKDFRRHVTKLSEDIDQYRVKEEEAAGES